MTRGNPYPHRYKYGKIKKPIGLDVFLQFMERVEAVDRSGYSVAFIQALHALFFWTGLRATEILGRKQTSYKVHHKECKGKGCVLCNYSGRVKRIGLPHPGVVKEDLLYQDGFLLVYSVDEKVLKHGKRVDPLYLHESLPFVPKIIEQWKSTSPGKRVFPITAITFWRICKRMDKKFTMHFYRHNRLTEVAGDEKSSLADVCAQGGVTPATAAHYMLVSGRYSKKVGERLKERYGRGEHAP